MMRFPKRQGLLECAFDSGLVFVAIERRRDAIATRHVANLLFGEVDVVERVVVSVKIRVKVNRYAVIILFLVVYWCAGTGLLSVIFGKLAVLRALTKIGRGSLSRRR